MLVSVLTSVRLILKQRILIIGSRTSLLEVRHIIHRCRVLCS